MPFSGPERGAARCRGAVRVTCNRGNPLPHNKKMQPPGEPGGLTINIKARMPDTFPFDTSSLTTVEKRV